MQQKCIKENHALITTILTMHCISTKKSRGNVDFSIDWIGGYNAVCILIVLQQFYLKSKWFKLMHCDLLFDCLLFHVITISEIRILVTNKYNVKMQRFIAVAF